MAEIDDKLNEELNEFADQLACDFISAIEDNTLDKGELTPMHLVSMFEAAGEALAEPFQLLPADIQKLAMQVFFDCVSSTTEEPN